MLHQRIKEIGKTKGLSINQIEKEIGIKTGNICKWDKHKPSYDKVNAVAKLLGVSVEELTEGVD